MPAVEETDMGKRSEKRRTWEKAIAAAALLVIFGTVVFSMPTERLAWQGPLVMGTLALPKPNPAKYLRTEPRPEADPLFSFLGFLSVAGIFGLAGRRLLTKSSPVKVPEKIVLPLVFP